MRMPGVALLAAAALCAACTNTNQTAPQPAPVPAASASAAPSVSATPQATIALPPLEPPSDAPEPAGTEAPAPGGTQAPDPPTQPQPAPPPGQRLELGPGQTARLTYFDVTFQRFAHGQDGVSAGWRVEVCYRRPHPQQNADNTTRVSSDPWSVLVYDAEGGGGRPTWVGINEFERDNEWSPPYPTNQLRLGACQTGWLGVRHGNPDFQFQALRYAPADFGDVVTWSL